MVNSDGICWLTEYTGVGSQDGEFYVETLEAVTHSGDGELLGLYHRYSLTNGEYTQAIESKHADGLFPLMLPCRRIDCAPRTRRKGVQDAQGNQSPPLR